MDIAIDFDGTCVAHEFPKVGKDIGAVPVLKDLVNFGHNLILYTMRSGDFLGMAQTWFRDNGIELYGVQYHPSQAKWTSSNKCYAELYIDDAALGISLISPKNERPYVDWIKVRIMLDDMGLFNKD